MRILRALKLFRALKQWAAAIGGATAFAGFAAGAWADGGETGAGPVAVELFTSQSCSSCVPAAAVFSDLAAREDVVALAWHVDYWNALQTKKGRWADPYSSAMCTERQRAYNLKIRKRSSVFTPQIVVAGDSETVGSYRDKVSDLIDAAKDEIDFASVTAEREADAVAFDIGASKNGGNALLVTFKLKTITEVEGGENAGLKYHNVNAVVRVARLGVVRRMGARFVAPAPDRDYGCALIVQEPGQGRIIAAAYCPSS